MNVYNLELQSDYHLVEDFIYILNWLNIILLKQHVPENSQTWALVARNK